LRIAEWKSYDARAQRVADPAEAHPDIVFVDVDSNSLEAMRGELGRWPWRRDAHAALLDYVRAGGARAVVFDVLFAEPDRLDPGADSLFAERLAGPEATVLALTFAPGRADEAVELERLRAREDAELGRALALLHDARLPGGPAPGADLPYVEAPAALFLE